MKVGIDNGVEKYVTKEEGRICGPKRFGTIPAKLNVKGDKARFNAEIIEIGAEKAIE